jgi:hypothetical protein
MFIFKRLDASSGEGSVYYFNDNKRIEAKWVITGTPSAPIKIFELREERQKFSLYKANCSNWNGASVSLQIKMLDDESEDTFSDTGIILTDNIALSSEIR